jgi:membrane-bound lytic murein transglycosylase D
VHVAHPGHKPLNGQSILRDAGVEMRSTSGPRPHREGGRWLLAGVLGWVVAGTVQAANTLCPETTIPRPQALEKDVQFWVRVYTEVDTNSGFLHDQYNLSAVYSTLRFPADSTPHEREHLVDAERSRINAALRHIADAAGDAELSADERRIKALWGPEATARTFREAQDNVRFQLGQSDRFQAGLRRSGAWEKHIEDTLASLNKEDGGMPCEFAVLPHVESNFNYAAYSKVGAAGMWQFMRSTGRRFLRIDASVDERMDPFKSTIAAAQLLEYNYRLLGTWPLALTAYNSGAGGMRRAEEELKTDDIVKIVREYHGPTFGFASRNYYVEFLAALEIDRNPEKYFPRLVKDLEVRFQEVAVPASVKVAALERIVRIDGQRLRELNPALLPGVWEGRRAVPRNYLLRLPMDGPRWTTAELVTHLRPGDTYVAAQRHKVQRGETLAAIAGQYGISAEVLAHANRLHAGARLTPGRTLTIPAPLTPLADSGPALADVPPPRPVSSVPVVPVRNAEPPAGVPSPASSDVTNIYVVGAGDSFSDIASRNGISEAELLRINGLRNEDFISQGQELVVRQPPATVSPAAPGAPGAPGAPPPLPVVASLPPAAASPPAALPGAKPAEMPAEMPAAATAVTGEGSPPAAPPPVSPLVADASEGGAVQAEEAQHEADADAEAVDSGTSAEASQPVSAAQVEEITPSVGPADTQQNPDPTDYTIAKDGTIRVAPTESLGQYAEWLEVSPAHLAQLNHMKHGGRPLQIGHRVHLEFANVNRKQFEAKRRHYHQSLQAAYFASHRIVGQSAYVAKKGDTYWHISERYSKVPIWLVQQYNPDVDLTDVHAGLKLVIPRVEIVDSGDD